MQTANYTRLPLFDIVNRLILQRRASGGAAGSAAPPSFQASGNRAEAGRRAFFQRETIAKIRLWYAFGSEWVFLVTEWTSAYRSKSPAEPPMSLRGCGAVGRKRAASTAIHGENRGAAQHRRMSGAIADGDGPSPDSAQIRQTPRALRTPRSGASRRRNSRRWRRRCRRSACRAVPDRSGASRRRDW